MNWLDYLLIVILRFSGGQEFQLGLSREVIGLVEPIMALVLACGSMPAGAH